MVWCSWSPDRVPRLWCCPVAQSRMHKGWDGSAQWPSTSWREGEVTQTSSSKRLRFPRDQTWRQWTIIGGEAGRVQWEGYRFKVSEAFQRELSKPEMGYRESCGLLFRRNAEVTTEKLHHGLSAEFSRSLRVGQGASSSPFPQPHLSGSPACFAEFTGCWLLNYRSEICYLWEIIKDLSFSRLPLVKWVLLLSF